VTSPETTSVVQELHRELYSGLLTLDEAAQALGISRHSLAQLTNRGELRAVRIGGTFYIGEGTLRGYIADVRGTTSPTCPAPRRDPGTDD